MATTALDGVLPDLRCPLCAAALARRDAALVCGDGHAFDIARQGYVTLRTGRRGPGTGDVAAMVQARDRFLAAGHYTPLRDAVVRAASTVDEPGSVVDLAGGTGYYLGAVLGAAPERLGVCIDLSAPALRRAARAHQRAAAIGADAWGRLPLRDGSAAAVLSIFGPRNVDEIARVLVPGGLLVVASPRPHHLRELVQPLGLVGVDPDKERREDTAFARFERRHTTEVTYRMSLRHGDMQALISMGPSARHVDASDVAVRVAPLPEPLGVTVAVQVASYATAR